MRARWTIVSALGGALVTALALSASSAPAPIVVAAPPVAAGRPELDRAVLRQELRAAIAAELGARAPGRAHAAAAADADADAADADADAAAAPPTADQDDAGRAAMTVVASAIDAGRWTAADNAALAPVAMRLTDDTRGELMRTWATAVNEQRLVIESPPNF